MQPPHTPKRYPSKLIAAGFSLRRARPAAVFMLSLWLGTQACGDSAPKDDRCPVGQVRLPDGTCAPECDTDEIRDSTGACVPCGEHETARDNRCVCVPGYVAIDGLCQVAQETGPGLGTDWHPDPDGDGVTTGDDDCPYIYDPAQSDADGDGLGDACDPDFAPPTEGGPVTDLRAEHVTPYGAWVTFTSPRSETYGWTGYVVWAQDSAQIQDLAGVQAAVDRSDAVPFTVYAPFGKRALRPVWITAMDPDTHYFLRLVREDWTGLVDEMSNVLEITTLPAPPIQLASTRPRVFATPALVQALQERVARGDSRFAAWEAKLGPRAVAAAQDPDSVYHAPWYCQTAATLYLATGNPDYRAAGLALLDQLTTYWEDNDLDGNAYRWANAALGACLDLLWNELDGPTRDRAAAAMLDDDERHVFDDPPRAGDTDEFASTIRTQLVDGLSLCDATDLSADLADRGCVVLDAGLRGWYGVQLVKARRDRGFWAQSGGYLPDGSDYGQGTTMYWLESFLAAHNAGDDISGYAPWVRNSLFSKVIYSLTPTRYGYYTQGDVEDFTYNYDLEPSSFQLEGADAALVALHGSLLDAAGDTEGASWARGLIDDLFEVDDDAGEASVWRLLFEQDDLPGTDYRDSLGQAFLDSGLGLLFDRSGWDADASMLVFRAGWSGVDHSHEDLGHFQLFRARRWITHEAIAYDGPAAKARGHNVILLQQKDNEGEEDCVCQRLGRSSGQARIIRVSSGPSHSLATADLTGTYNSYYYHSDYYDRVQRTVFWRKTDGSGGSDILVVYDLVDRAADAPSDLRQGWILQLDAEPILSDNRATVVLPGSLDGGPEQRLDVVAVLPDEAQLSYDPPQGEPDDFPGPLYTHRLEMSATTTDPGLRMVTVLRAADEEPPALQAEPVDTDQVVGVLLDGETILFARAPLASPDQGPSQISVDLATTTPITVWWTGFRPDQRYDVTATQQAGTITLAVTSGSSLAADQGGLLAFTVAADGQVQAVYTEN